MESSNYINPLNTIRLHCVVGADWLQGGAGLVAASRPGHWRQLASPGTRTHHFLPCEVMWGHIVSHVSTRSLFVKWSWNYIQCFLSSLYSHHPKLPSLSLTSIADGRTKCNEQWMLVLIFGFNFEVLLFSIHGDNGPEILYFHLDDLCQNLPICGLQHCPQVSELSNLMSGQCQLWSVDTDGGVAPRLISTDNREGNWGRAKTQWEHCKGAAMHLAFHNSNLVWLVWTQPSVLIKF